MLNIAVLHACLNDFETAARWADTAYRFGLMHAAENAREYREMARLNIPPDVSDAISEFMANLYEGYEDPTVERTSRVPSVEELRAIGTPYGERLVLAKEEMIVACHFVAPDFRMMVKAVQLAARAKRIDDGFIVFTMEEQRAAFIAATFLMNNGVELNPDLALCLGVSDPSSMVSFWKSMQLKFPNDLTIIWRAACMCMFSGYPGADRDLSVRLFEKALSLLPRPDDDSDPTTMGLLYNSGAAFFKTYQFSRSQDILSRFLKHASSDGHRKAAEAHFMLGLMLIRDAYEPVSGRELTNEQLKRLELEARAHLHEGRSLEDRLPGFLRKDNASPHRKCLEAYLDTIAMANPTPRAPSPQTKENSIKRGGELLPGPRRHPKLRSDMSLLCAIWRKNFAKNAQEKRSCSAFIPISLTPPRSSASGSSQNPVVPTTIDELFSGLKDHVYEGRSIECVIVSTPVFTGSSYQMIVEDSQREPARLAVYNCTPLVVQQLVPGQSLTLLNPYVRIAKDGSIWLRVDNPSGTVQLKTKHSICWVCSVEDQSDHRLSSCSKCHKAFYCSRACQKQDWTVDGHRFMCATLKTQ